METVCFEDTKHEKVFLLLQWQLKCLLLEWQFDTVVHQEIIKLFIIDDQ